MIVAERLHSLRPWIGDIPRSWSLKKLKAIAQFTTGWTPPTGDSSSYVGTNAWANIGDLGGRVISETANHISDEAVQRIGIPLSPIGSLLFSFKLSVGQVSFAGRPLYTNEAIATFPPQEGLHTPWAFYAFPYFIPENAARNIYGAKLLNQQRINDAMLAVPPLEEQVAISNYLDAETARIDAMVSAKKDLLFSLGGLLRGTFFHELSSFSFNSERGYPSTWSRCKFKHIVMSFDQGVSPQCEARVPGDGEWGVLKAGCINSGNLDILESKALPSEIPPVPEVTVKSGDLINSRANTQSLVGRCAVARVNLPKLMLSDKLYRVKLDRERCIPEFVRELLWLPNARGRIEERATGASQSMVNIDRRTILELDLVLPPLDTQQEILNRTELATNKARALLSHVEREIELLVTLRASTITDAVLGRIDVRKNASC